MAEGFSTSDQVVTAADLLRRLSVVDEKVARLLKRTEKAEARVKELEAVVPIKESLDRVIEEMKQPGHKPLIDICFECEVEAERDKLRGQVAMMRQGAEAVAAWGHRPQSARLGQLAQWVVNDLEAALATGAGAPEVAVIKAAARAREECGDCTLCSFNECRWRTVSESVLDMQKA